MSRMAKTQWHLKITLESSTQRRAEELARADSRSAANYVQVLIEKAAREKEPSS